MRGCLTSADFWGWGPFRMVRRTSVSRRQCQYPIASAGAGESVRCLAACKANCKCVAAARRADTCCCTALRSCKRVSRKGMCCGDCWHTRHGWPTCTCRGAACRGMTCQQFTSSSAACQQSGISAAWICRSQSLGTAALCNGCNSSRCWSSRCGCAFNACFNFQQSFGAAACTISMAKQGRKSTGIEPHCAPKAQMLASRSHANELLPPPPQNGFCDQRLM